MSTACLPSMPLPCPHASSTQNAQFFPGGHVAGRRFTKNEAQHACQADSPRCRHREGTIPLMRTPSAPSTSCAASGAVARGVPLRAARHAAARSAPLRRTGSSSVAAPKVCCYRGGTQTRGAYAAIEVRGALCPRCQSSPSFLRGKSRAQRQADTRRRAGAKAVARYPPLLRYAPSPNRKA